MACVEWKRQLVQIVQQKAQIHGLTEFGQGLNLNDRIGQYLSVSASIQRLEEGPHVHVRHLRSG